MMKRNMAQLHELIEEYGIHFSEIKTTAGRAYIGDVERTGRYGEKVSILYPKKFYKSRTSLLDALKKAADDENMPRIGGRNIDVYATTHEFAHTFSERLTSSLYGGNEDFWDEIESIYFDYKKNGNNVLGKYASFNQNEFVAEAFAEAKLGVGPSEYSKKVLEIIDKHFKKPVAKRLDSGIININLQLFAYIPKEKLVDYALNPNHPIGKAKASAFKAALGYTKENSEELRVKILELFSEDKMVLKQEGRYGKQYEQIMRITGPNGKTANVLTAWIKEDENSEPRLTSLYVTEKETK